MVSARRVLLICIAAFSVTQALHLEVHADPPSWFQKKKKDKEEKKQEAEMKDKEQAVVGGNNSSELPKSSQLSVNKAPPPRPFLLFKREGITEGLTVDFGYFSQPEVNGRAFSAQYNFGWWALPELITAFYGRATGIFDNTYVFLMVGVGIQARYMLQNHWLFSAYGGWAMSQGLSRIGQAHVPVPPSETMLRARRGFTYSAQVAYLFWSRRDIAMAPFLGYWRGSQDERTFSSFVIGLTFIGGRPNYTGDVTPF